MSRWERWGGPPCLRTRTNTAAPTRDYRGCLRQVGQRMGRQASIPRLARSGGVGARWLLRRRVCRVLDLGGLWMMSGSKGCMTWKVCLRLVWGLGFSHLSCCCLQQGPTHRPRGGVWNPGSMSEAGRRGVWPRRLGSVILPQLSVCVCSRPSLSLCHVFKCLMPPQRWLLCFSFLIWFDRCSLPSLLSVWLCIPWQPFSR
mmetsp:Transcript_15356/g.38596  ORF Transcript_15356/g.38596 Transcript_15356/m.38596 type:complete len:200 (-) Transcript_15356:110-709(-)